MHVRHVPVAKERFDRDTAVLGRARRQVVEPAIGRGPPQQGRCGLAEEANLLLAFPQLLLDAAAFELGGCPAGDKIENRAGVVSRRVHRTVVHDHQQAVRLPVHAAERSACVTVDTQVRQHAIQGEPVTDPGCVEARDPRQDLGTGCTGEVVLDFLRGFPVGPSGHDLDSAWHLWVESTEVHPADR